MSGSLASRWAEAVNDPSHPKAKKFFEVTIRLDSPRERPMFVADPDSAVIGLNEPTLLDEWQVVPEVLGAVKRSVDRNRGFGRYILTGSAYP